MDPLRSALMQALSFDDLAVTPPIGQPSVHYEAPDKIGSRKKKLQKRRARNKQARKARKRK